MNRFAVIDIASQYAVFERICFVAGCKLVDRVTDLHFSSRNSNNRHFQNP